jgi:hypothetical protein
MWNTDHLRHDEVHECTLPPFTKAHFTGISSDLTAEVRDAFRFEGWEFGDNVFVIKRCPGCPEDTDLLDRSSIERRTAAMEGIVSVLGNDLDGIASNAEDMGIWNM